MSFLIPLITSVFSPDRLKSKIFKYIQISKIEIHTVTLAEGGPGGRKSKFLAKIQFFENFRVSPP
jgi:hypothetical protein